jgi:hypothetical protein
MVPCILYASFPAHLPQAALVRVLLLLLKSLLPSAAQPERLSYGSELQTKQI